MVELAKKAYLFIFVAFICQKLFFRNHLWIYASRIKMPEFLRGTLGLDIF